MIFEKLKTLIKSKLQLSKYPITSSNYPIIPEVAELSLSIAYEYDTVYEVYLEWDKDINSTKEIFKLSQMLISKNIIVYPWDLSKRFVMRYVNSISETKIGVEDLKGMKLLKASVK